MSSIVEDIQKVVLDNIRKMPPHEVIAALIFVAVTTAKTFEIGDHADAIWIKAIESVK